MAGSSRLSRWLANADARVFSAYSITAAFGTYFCMYAFRKPFTAATYEDLAYWGIGYKTILVASQVSGYTLSKFLGIKFVSEMPAHRRAIGIVLLIATAELALLLFALTPPPWNLVWLFANGLPLGMVFGLVLAYLEGRRLTEALAAGLCASFILSSGVVKSVGSWLMQSHGVSEFWMPSVTGLMFFPLLLLFVAMLNQIPEPSEDDVALRSKRAPMRHAERRAFFGRHLVGLCCLLGIYTLLTILRSLRDDFAVEIWRDLGYTKQPAIFTQSELAVMFGVVLINGSATFILSNRRAFLTSLLLLSWGFLLVLLCLLGHWQGWFPPFVFMVMIGLGTYVPYVAFHTTVFERLIAAFRESGNIGYLMYLADAVGYLGYVGVMALRNLVSPETQFLELFLMTALVIAGLSLLITLILMRHYLRYLPQETPAEVLYETR